MVSPHPTEIVRERGIRPIVRGARHGGPAADHESTAARDSHVHDIPAGRGETLRPEGSDMPVVIGDLHNVAATRRNVYGVNLVGAVQKGAAHGKLIVQIVHAK